MCTTNYHPTYLKGVQNEKHQPKLKYTCSLGWISQPNNVRLRGSYTVGGFPNQDWEIVIEAHVGFHLARGVQTVANYQQLTLLLVCSFEIKPPALLSPFPPSEV